MLKIGIVGLPNVGKSTLFNAITNLEIEAANYPFATIEPNVSVIEIKDKRMEFLKSIYNPKKMVYSQIQFVDIAGLVKGASKGEGLGNQFLSNIREVDAIIHVTRLFEDAEIVHVEGNIDPIRDIKTIDLELILSDLEQVQRWLERNEKKIMSGAGSREKLDLFKRIKNHLESEKKLSNFKFAKGEEDIIKTFNFLTLKPMLLMGNLLEEEIISKIQNKHLKNIKNYCKDNNYILVPSSIKLEYELSKIKDEEEQKEFLDSFGIEESSLNILIKNIFSLLRMGNYFTCGEKEVHSWTFPLGINAQKGAGIIHSDFERGFIRAEIFNIKELKDHKSESKLKELGKIKLEGKDYILNDGDIVHFRFNV